VLLHQDARVYAGLFTGSESAQLQLSPQRQAYLQVARGSISANGERLTNGDALQLTQADTLVLANGEDAEVLVFDLPV
jgi:hypothetical protein